MKYNFLSLEIPKESLIHSTLRVEVLEIVPIVGGWRFVERIIFEVVRSPWIMSASCNFAICFPIVWQIEREFGRESRCSDNFFPLINCISIFSLLSEEKSSGVGINFDAFCKRFASLFVLKRRSFSSSLERRYDFFVLCFRRTEGEIWSKIASAPLDIIFCFIVLA